MTYTRLVDESDDVSKVFLLDEVTQRYEYLITRKYNNRMYFIADITENDDGSFVYVERHYRLRLGKKIYPALSKKNGFTYKDGKIKMFFGSSVASFRYLDKLLAYLRHEWVINENFIQRDYVRHMPVNGNGGVDTTVGHLLTKSVLEKIFSGKITNPHDLCKVIIRTQRYKGLSPESLRKSIKNNAFIKHIMGYKDVVTDIHDLLDTDMQKEMIKNSSTRDTLDQARVFNDVRINLRWSEKRMESVHQTLTRRIMETSVAAKSDRQIVYPFMKDVSLPSGFTLLDTEKKVFEEASIQSHCLYTNYYSKIERGEYMAFKVSKNGVRCTVGVKLRPSALIDQINGYRNSYVGDVDIYKHAENIVNQIRTFYKDKPLETNEELLFDIF